MKYNHLKPISMVFFKYALMLSIIALLSCETDDQQTVARFTELTLSEEFDTNGQPNASIWGYDIGTGENGWGNQELQYYTDRPENVNVQNGVHLS